MIGILQENSYLILLKAKGRVSDIKNTKETFPLEKGDRI